MKNVNQKRNYGLIKWGPTGAIGTATHEGVDRWIPSLGATIRTGGEIDLVMINPMLKIAKKNRNILRKVTRLNNNASHQSAISGTNN